MVDLLSFFKPRRPNLLQIGQIRHQSTPLYLYIQNINLVCHSDLLWDELGRENGVYTPPNAKAKIDCLSFFKPMRPKLLQIGQIRHQFTPLYLYIQNINLVCHSDLLWDELGRENGVYTPPNTKVMVDRLSFFKPRRPNLLQIGQIRHQSTPLYLYIQNIKLVCNSGIYTLYTGKWSFNTVCSLTSVVTVTMMPMKVTTFVERCKDGNNPCMRLHLLVCS